MEERTFIPQVDCDCLYFQLTRCEVYEDAKKLLNSFVLDFIKLHGGEVYDAGFDLDEHFNKIVLQYKNSKNPNDVKRAVFDALIKVIDQCELFAKEVLGRIDEEIIKNDWQHVTNIRKSEKDTYMVRRWAEAWRKEAAPIIKEEKTPRLRPIKEEVNKYIKLIFLQLKTLRYIDEQTKDTTWNYLCGVTDEVPKTPIKWIGGLFELNVLIERFLTKQSYFIVSNVAISFICSLMVDENAHEIKYDSLKSTKTREFAKNPKRVDEVWNKMKLNGML